MHVWITAGESYFLELTLRNLNLMSLVMILPEQLDSNPYRKDLRGDEYQGVNIHYHGVRSAIILSPSFYWRYIFYANKLNIT